MKSKCAKIFCVAAAWLFCGIFPSCGGGSEPIVDEKGVIIQDNQVYYLDPDVEGDSLENKTRIKITFAETGFGRTWLENAAKTFVYENSEYWIYLDGDPEVTTGFTNKLETGAAIADIYMVLASNWYDLALKGWIEPIDDVYDSKPDGESGKTVREKTDEVFLEYSKATVRNETKSYVLPWNENVTGIVYNADMFEEYGWEIPETMDEMVALCNQIISDTKGEVSPFVYPGSVGGYFDFLVNNWWLQVSGVEKVQEFFDFGSADVFNYRNAEDPSYGKLVALNQFNRLFGNKATGTYNGEEYSYTLSGSASKNHLQAQQSFIRGEAAMIPNGGWMECEMTNSLPDGFTMRMMRTPYIDDVSGKDGQEYISYNYSAQPDYMLIPSKANNIEGAKKFLSFLQRDDILKQYTRDTGSARPFEYELDSSFDYTDFTDDCLEIWENSDYNYFEQSKSALWLNGKVKLYNTVSPFTRIRSGEMTPAVFCGTEYNYVKENWDIWLSEISAN